MYQLQYADIQEDAVVDARTRERQLLSRSIELLDLEDPGALNPADIGQLEENKAARAKRLARDAEAG